MYGKEMFLKGVYSVVDTSLDKTVYVGSTNKPMMVRWANHVNKTKSGTHCNNKLATLINSGNFAFNILEAGEFTKRELLALEKHYTDKLGTSIDGYNLYVGGGALTHLYNTTSTLYTLDNNIQTMRDYINDNWFNTKIYAEDKTTIEVYLADHGIKVSKFMVALRRLGFKVQRYSDKRSWLITETTY